MALVSFCSLFDILSLCLGKISGSLFDAQLRATLENLPDQGERNPSNRFGKWVWYRHCQSYLYIHRHYELEPEMSILNGPSLLKMSIFPELSDARQNLMSN
jgi:hypothetical protein